MHKQRRLSQVGRSYTARQHRTRRLSIYSMTKRPTGMQRRLWPLGYLCHQMLNLALRKVCLVPKFSVLRWFMLIQDVYTHIRCLYSYKMFMLIENVYAYLGCVSSYRMFIHIQDVYTHIGCLYSYKMVILIKDVYANIGCLCTYLRFMVLCGNQREFNTHIRCGLSAERRLRHSNSERA